MFQLKNPPQFDKKIMKMVFERWEKSEKWTFFISKDSCVFSPPPNKVTLPLFIAMKS